MSDGAMITLPVLPLRDIVVFPHMIVPLFVGREKSIRALEAVMAEDKQIILVTQKEADTEDPDADGLYVTGTVGSILQLLKLPDGAVKVLVEGGERVNILPETLHSEHGFLAVDSHVCRRPAILVPIRTGWRAPLFSSSTSTSNSTRRLRPKF
jgi:ATP-dependent Lon protease